MKNIKQTLWLLGNIYGYIFGRTWLAPLHRVIILFCLHGLGYDNALRGSFSGEQWFIKHVLAPKKPRVCIDVGANVGAYSALLLQHTTATVFSIEPAKTSFVQLSKNCSSVCVQTAIADYVGTAVLYSKGECSETASLHATGTSALVPEEVPVTTLEQFVKDHTISEVDFVKIDTEGFEHEVISGLGAIRPLMIQFEFNKMHLEREVSLLSICNLLPEYTFYRLLPNALLPIDPKAFVNNIYMFSNIVALRS